MLPKNIKIRIYKTIILHECERRGIHIGYWWESQKERDHWEDQDVSGWTILKWIGWDGMGWIYLA
jgi:hypothetical protein